MYDERSGTHYAKILHEKGFDNVYLLSGGIEKFYETFHEHVEGTDLPPLPKIKTTKTTTKGSTSTKSQASTLMGKSTTTFTSNATTKK